MSKLVLPPKLPDISAAITCIACILQKPIAEVLIACNISDINPKGITREELRGIFHILGYETIPYATDVILDQRIYMLVVADLNNKGLLKWVIADYLTVPGELHYLDPVMEGEDSYNIDNPPKMYTNVIEVLIAYNYFLGDNASNISAASTD